MKCSALLAALTALLLAFASATPAAATAEDLDPRLAYALEMEPGGMVIDGRTAYWPHLAMTLTLPGMEPRGLSKKCPTGLICAFQYLDEAGPRLTWASCGTYSTTALPSVGSVASARSTGYVQARNGTTVLATASAGNYTNVGGATNNIRCVA